MAQYNRFHSKRGKVNLDLVVSVQGIVVYLAEPFLPTVRQPLSSAS